MTLLSSTKLSGGAKICLYFALIYFPIFLHLDSLPIRVWDESRLAINAWEMDQTGDWIVTQWNGKPDMWNTKPPFLVWLQVICIKFFGANELSIRLPGAIGAFFTALTLLVFSMRYLKDYWLGLIASLVLVTSYGYINEHVVRSGEYDSLLVFFMTAYPFLFFAYVETGKNKFLHLFFLALTLGVLTKSSQPLMSGLALPLYLLFRKKWGVLLNKWVYIGAFLSLCTIFGYYFLREHYNPGYMQAVWDNEFGGRYLNELEKPNSDYLFYYNLLITHHYTDWYWLVPCGLLLGAFSRNERIRRTALMTTLLVLSYGVTASVSYTKMQWYEAPLFPYFAMLAALLLFEVFTWLKNLPVIHERLKYNVAPYVFLFIVFMTPYRKMIDKVYFPKEYVWDYNFYQVSYWVQDAMRGKKDLTGYDICYEAYNSHIKFYTNILNKMGNPITFIDWKTLKKGNKVLVGEPHIQQYIESNYHLETLHASDGIRSYLIHGSKSLN